MASVLVPVSAGLSNSPALISQLLHIKREVSGYYPKPSDERERERRRESVHVLHPSRVTAPPVCHLRVSARAWHGGKACNRTNNNIGRKGDNCLEYKELYRLNIEKSPKLLTDSKSWMFSETASFLHLRNRKKTLTNNNRCSLLDDDKVVFTFIS